ncbi:MAG: site-specific DNA-methyltransferase [Alphaproteobacteria bacterium]|nr:site-specific DNA-methyltransferase [Alphaproteobacteria bacterium]
MTSRNRTIRLNGDQDHYMQQLLTLDSPIVIKDVENKIIYQDIFSAINFLPDRFVDLAFIDPPYNLDKKFNKNYFKAMSNNEYEKWLDSWLSKIVRLLKPNASIYLCGDWHSSSAIFRVASKYFVIRNRISFEREKGRGAKKNWKNCSEDIWFCTVSDDYYFDVDSVKLKKKIIAPYRDVNGQAKDWEDSIEGKYRLTYPSNIWTDITIPFWSMPENTDHPTQKPEKLLAKIILASSRPGDMIFDPFLGSGTTAVVAYKLERKFLGVEIDSYYCCLAQKRLAMAINDNFIQGYSEGVFWERNSKPERKNKIINKPARDSNLFEEEYPIDEERIIL